MKINLNNNSTAANTAQAFSMLIGASNNKDNIKQISPDKLIPYPDQPFKPYSEDKLLELAEDIELNGILSPVVVRELNDGNYQILSGHNRTSAGKLAGLTAIPCIVINVDDSTAELIMVNSNLNQRHELLPSEKAFAYKLQKENIKMQGKRTDLTLYQFDTKYDSAKIVGEHNSESRANICRYIRLTSLIPELLKITDENKLPLGAGVNLSYINTENQKLLFEYIEENEISITLKQSEKLKELNDFDAESLANFFSSKKTSVRQKKITLKFSDLKDFFDDDVSDEEIQDVIIQALQYYKNKSPLDT